MSKFLVSIPIAGTISIEIDAEDHESADAAAWEEYHQNGADNFYLEWEALPAITTGNVLHASQNEVRVEKLKETKP